MTTLTHHASTVDRALLEDIILQQVAKPARYIGLEEGAYRKDFDKARVRMAVAFPDLYEIGVSNYGLKILYSLVNQDKRYMCDRVYAPAPDLKVLLTEYDFPLYGVESFVALKDFDVLAFTLQYELNYTTILGLLDSAQIPFRSKDRRASEIEYPLLVAGGPGSGNPIPLAPFFDAFIIGDGEEIIIELMELLEESKKKNWSNTETLEALAEVEGMFVPGYTETATKRIVDIAEHPVDLAPLIPAIQAVHDRVTVEARRGCDRMCRFCQPCFINLPVREQSVENIKSQALKEIEKTGYEECSLLSLSIADYSHFKPLILDVAEALKDEGISLSLPSQRADRFSLDVAEAVQTVRKSTLTFAPEAGSQRLRDVINKNLSDEEIVSAVTSSYKTGWNKVKLYFIIGLPTETLDDLDGIHEIVTRLQEVCKEIRRNPLYSIKGNLEINVTLSNFVPKPHTPFQWFPQDSMEMLNGKKAYIKDKFQNVKGVKLNFTDPEISKLEAVISKGDESLSDVLETAYLKGAYLDAWDDIISFDKWFEALKDHGVDWEAYTRERCVDVNDVLPWDVIDMGLTKAWLVDEYDKAKAEAATVPCFEACSTCGVCANYNTWPKFMEPPKEWATKPEWLSHSNANVDGLAVTMPTKIKNEDNDANAKQTFKNTGVVIETQEMDPESGETVTKKKHMTPAEHKNIERFKGEPTGRLRVLIEKKERLKFISHLDWLRLIHRAAIRSGIPMAYTQGFNPGPKVSFGPALPLFSESDGEYVDIMLKADHDADKARELLNKHLPDGGKILSATLSEPYITSIDAAIRSTKYVARVADLKNLVNSNEQLEVKTQSPLYDGHLPQEKSIQQGTCLDGGLSYTIEERVSDLQSKLNSNESINTEIETKKSRKQREKQEKIQQRNKNKDLETPEISPEINYKEIIDLAPYLSDLRYETDGHVSFTIHRITDENGKARAIKPKWVLDSIQPGLHWSLKRTGIELDSPVTVPSVQPAG